MTRIFLSISPAIAVLILVALAVLLVGLLIVASRFPDDDDEGNG